MAAEGIKNDPRPSDAPEPSTERVTAHGLEGQSPIDPLPSAWLDRLLTAYCQVRSDAPIEDSITQILGAARDILDGAALGVSVPRTALPSGGSEVGRTNPYLPGSQPPGQVVVRLSPSHSIPPVSVEGGRLFPDLAFHKVIPLAGLASATLHAASNDENLFLDGSAPAQLLERVAEMLRALIENQGAAERSLRDLRAQIIQSEKLASLGQIAAGIVHELNNPLTTIVAYSDFLRRKLASRGDAADVERLSRINEAADRILRFSRDLTAYSRPANEVPGPVAIHDVLERALVFCEHEIEKTGINVERDFAEVRPVRGVAGQLTQVFVNLFTNAAHAMRTDGGLLSVATEMRDETDEVAIIVTDDGHGIDEQHRLRIFDPFFTTKTDGSGTGLGLSIVRSIVLSHGGRINVGTRVPRGTVFEIYLPAAALPDE